MSVFPEGRRSAATNPCDVLVGGAGIAAAASVLLRRPNVGLAVVEPRRPMAECLPPGTGRLP